MVEVIYDLKNQLLDEMIKEVNERGIDHLDKEQVDMIKDFAEAEKDCWKAAYYRTITEEMERGGSGYPMSWQQVYGYSSGGMSGAQQGGMSRSGSSSSYGGNRGGNSGSNSSGYRDSMGRYAARRGYDNRYMSGYHDHIDALRNEIMNANPQERERIMQELRNIETMQ